MVVLLTDVQPAPDPERGRGFFTHQWPSFHFGRSLIERQSPAPTLRRDLPINGGPVHVSGQPDATRPGDNTPDHYYDRGFESYRTQRPVTPMESPQRKGARLRRPATFSPVEGLRVRHGQPARHGGMAEQPRHSSRRCAPGPPPDAHYRRDRRRAHAAAFLGRT